MKAILSALLIVLSGVTAVVAQQTALASLEDDSNSAAKNDQALRDDRVLRHKDPPQVLEPNRGDNQVLEPNRGDNLEYEPGIFYSAFVKLGDFMVLVVVVNDNLNLDQIFCPDDVVISGTGSWFKDAVGNGIAASDSPIEGIVITGSGTWFTDAAGNEVSPFFSRGLHNNYAYELKNVQVVSIRVDNLVNGPMQEAPVFYMPHYTDFNGVVAVVLEDLHCVMPNNEVTIGHEKNLKNDSCKASQNNNNTEAAIDANEVANENNDSAEAGDGTNDEDVYISHPNEEDEGGQIDVPDIPYTGNWKIDLVILILNWDHDGDGDSILDDIVNWVISVFKGDEEGGSGEGEGDEGGDEGGDDEGGDDDGDCPDGEDCGDSEDGYRDPGNDGDGNPGTWY